MIEPGTRVVGYRVVRMIGRGGMGVVYEAEQVSLGRRVAPGAVARARRRPELIARFGREGRLQASLEHPLVLDVYEVGESEHGLFPGHGSSRTTLLDLLCDGELGAEWALGLLEQVTSALDAAHEAGLVRRDVKPQNMLVDEGDQAFLADFGLTRGEIVRSTQRPEGDGRRAVAAEVQGILKLKKQRRHRKLRCPRPR
jgi:serine/threonine-protein kinase